MAETAENRNAEESGELTDNRQKAAVLGSFLGS